MRGGVEMRNRIDDAIGAYLQDRSDAALRVLDRALIEEELHVPVSEPVSELIPGRYDVAVVCIKTDAGEGAIPVFTTVAHLFEWKPEGCLYTSLNGRSVIEMATGMEAISEILINPKGVPRGRIPRADFIRMLALP